MTRYTRGTRASTGDRLAASSTGLLALLLLPCLAAGLRAQEPPAAEAPPLADWIGEPREGAQPLEVHFVNRSAGGIQSYLWDFGDGSSSTQRDPVHLYRSPGTYHVSLEVRGPHGSNRCSRPGYVLVRDPARSQVEQTSDFGMDTPGGTGGVVLHVTSLAGSGPGSLREALSSSGPRIVVFDVGGVIDLERERLTITEPYLTLDGLAGPEPGITLIRGGISVRTHDVRISHLRVRPGDAGADPGSGWEPDGIGVWGPDAHDVLIQNCSISWAVDENFAVSGKAPPLDAPSRVTLRSCIVAEALNDSTHSEGHHSRGALIRGREVAVEGCLFAYNARRNPVFRDGASGLIVNNLIYDAGSAAIHLDGGRATIIGNVLVKGRDSLGRLLLLQGSGHAYVEDNLALDLLGEPVGLVDEREIVLLGAPPCARPEPWRLLPAGQVQPAVLAGAGARPGQRDEIDRRIIQQVLDGTGGLIDSQDQVGGYPH